MYGYVRIYAHLLPQTTCCILEKVNLLHISRIFICTRIWTTAQRAGRRGQRTPERQGVHGPIWEALAFTASDTWQHDCFLKPVINYASYKYKHKHKHTKTNTLDRQGNNKISRCKAKTTNKYISKALATSPGGEYNSQEFTILNFKFTQM